MDHFAHGELVTLGAVLAYFFHASTAGPGWALVAAAIPAVLLVAAFGGIQELGLWRPLRRRQTGTIAMLVISIGLSFAVRNVILVVFSGDPFLATSRVLLVVAGGEIHLTAEGGAAR